MLVFLVVSVYPLLTGLSLSFQDQNLYKGSKQGFIGLKNFAQVFFSDKEFRADFLFTVVYTLCVVLIAYALGLIFALLLNQKIPCRQLFRVLVLIPWIIPPVVSSMSWNWLLNDTFGFVNHFLKSVGVIDESILFLANKTLAKATVIAVGAWRNFPFMTVVILAGLQSVSHDYYEAASIDGAGAFQKFRYITLPMLKSVSVIAVTLVTIWTFNNFDNIYLLTKGGPAQSTEVLSILTYNNAFFRGSISYASAMATIMLLLMMAGSAIYFKVSKVNQE